MYLTSLGLRRSLARLDLQSRIGQDHHLCRLYMDHFQEDSCSKVRRFFVYWTALYWAAKSGHADAARVFVELGAKVDASNWPKWTPLRYAAWQGQVEVVEFLVSEHGASVDARNSDGETPLDVVKQVKSCAAITKSWGCIG